MSESASFKYQQVANQALAFIETRSLKPGDRLPSERQFADELGVGRPTVNKALACLIAEGKLRRDGYKLYVASPLKPQAPPKMLAVLCPHPLHQRKVVSHNLIEAAHDTCNQAKLRFTPLLSIDGLQQREQLLELLRQDQSCDGVVIWPHPDTHCHSLLEQFAARGTPVVINDIDMGSLDFVGVGNHEGIQQIMKHLVELGHRNIAYVTRALNNSNLVQRKESFNYARFNLLGERARSSIYELPGQQDETEALDEAFEQFLTASPRCTAIVCSHDYLALEILSRLRRRGIQVPADVSVTGFDGIDWSATSSPALTTVAQDFYQMGVLAVELLIRRIRNKHVGGGSAAQKIRVSPQFLKRGTTGPVPERIKRRRP